MPIIPVRGLSAGGVVRDQHPPSLPLTSWSSGRNVVFENGKVIRSPIWRMAQDGLGANVRFCATLPESSGYDVLVIARDDGSLAISTSGILTEASEEGFVPRAATPAPWTCAVLGDVFYINRPDGPPRSLVPGATQFTVLPNWPTGWTANVIRRFQDAIMALGITEGDVSIPSQINISDIAFFGQAPDSWDTTDPTKLAYSNDLAQLDGPVIDGLTLADRFLFYTKTQCWEMTSGGSFYYNFRLLFSNSGIINANCITEKDGVHYVFGSRDCYATDGTTIKYLGEGKVREWFYRTMQKSLTKRCFTAFIPDTNEIMFAHVSGDPDVAWKNPTGCNASWNWNLTTETWAPTDLPNITAMALCALNSTYVWASATAVTWSNVGGSWYDQQGTDSRRCVAINTPLSGVGNTTTIAGAGRALVYDFIDRGQSGFPQDSSCNAASYVARTGIALDNPDGGQSPIAVNKVIRGIYPEITVSQPLPVTIDFSASMTMSPPGGLVWEMSETFDPTVDDKVDCRESGRYLAIRFTFQPSADCEMSGFDLDVVKNGSRG